MNDEQLLDDEEYIESLYELLDQAAIAEDWEMYESIMLGLDKVT